MARRRGEDSPPTADRRAGRDASPETDRPSAAGARRTPFQPGRGVRLQRIEHEGADEAVWMKRRTPSATDASSPGVLAIRTACATLRRSSSAIHRAARVSSVPGASHCSSRAARPRHPCLTGRRPSRLTHGGRGRGRGRSLRKRNGSARHVRSWARLLVSARFAPGPETEPFLGEQKRWQRECRKCGRQSERRPVTRVVHQPSHDGRTCADARVERRDHRAERRAAPGERHVRSSRTP